MSTESLEWLNRNTLVGFADKRGTAWHERQSLQGDEPNHYNGAIPIEDVRRRLFSWKAIEMPMFIQIPDSTELREVIGRKAIVRDDNFDILGTPSVNYLPHQYDEWLLTSVGNILDDDLQIGSAGLLKNGAIAWVQIEMPENSVVDGVEFRPHLLATTSFNGSISTTYKRTVTVVVCDNTRNLALGEKGQEYRVRHTAKSNMRLAEARDALSVVHELEADFAAEITELLSRKVSDPNFGRFVNVYAPIGNSDSAQAKGRAENFRAELYQLWNDDPRVTPWKNTAYGVLQTVNTHRQHIRKVRSGSMRLERNMMDTLTGKTQVSDIQAIRLLDSVAV